MKKVLILVLSSDFYPYDKMIKTSIASWDSIEVEGVETIFYCSQKDNPKRRSTDKVMYFDVDNGLYDMGRKNLAMFEWALANKKFDYVARVNASCYVEKINLIQYVQALPTENVFAGAEADSQNGFKYLWGGANYLISRDVLQKIVDNKTLWNHGYMEDESISLVVSALGIPYSQGYSGAIDKMPEGWRCISYGGESITFNEFSELKRLNHHFYRVKMDGQREMDKYVMEQLYKALNA